MEILKSNLKKEKINYQTLMEREICSLNGKKAKLLLHSCCAPCSSSVLEKLSEHFDITVLYYNPNIYPQEEYNKRFEEQTKLLKIYNISYIKAEYDYKIFLELSKGFEHEPENGTRCKKCFFMRIKKAAMIAAEKGFEYCATTLSVSPHKNVIVLNDILKETALEFGVKPLLADFKKKNGYKRSVQLSELYGLYRQSYCGCEFSLLHKK